MKLKSLIGDKAFYKMTFTVAVPIMLQNFITNLVNMLDNIMVGSVGTEQMTGVSVVNQLIFIFNLAIFGAISGVGIFTAQFYGKKDNDGIRYTLRYKLYICLVLFLIGAGVPGGVNFVTNLKLSYFLYGVVMTLVPMLFIDSGDIDKTIFKRLAEGFQRLTLKLRQLIEKENAVVSKRDFTRFGAIAAADHRWHGNIVMRRSERTNSHQLLVCSQFT